jgi:hypothetical protein
VDNKTSAKSDTKSVDTSKILHAGRLTLTGKLRQPTNLEKRETAAKKMNFTLMFNKQMNNQQLREVLG